MYDAIIDAAVDWAIGNQLKAFEPEQAAGRDRGDRDGPVRWPGGELQLGCGRDDHLPAQRRGPTRRPPNRFARMVADDLRAILQGPVSLEQRIELDLDLRPEGKNGPLVRSYASCKE